MDLTALGKTLSEVLPRLRGRIQLSGLIIIIVVGGLISLVKPGDYVSLTLIGGVGVGFIVFGQLFHFLTSFPEPSRPTVFLLSFISFLVFIIALAALFVLHIQPKPTFTINQAQAYELGYSRPQYFSATQPDQRPQVALASQVAVNEIGRKISLPALKAAEEVSYTYSEPADIPTLTPSFPYSQWSRSDQYPDGDFHQGVNWGSPWMSFNLKNPTKEVILYTSLQVDVVNMRLIREVILDVGEIDEYIYGKKMNMTMNNRGWGKAKDATLDLAVGREEQKSTYEIIASKTYSIGDLDDAATIDITNLIPKDAKWGQSGSSAQCPAPGYLTGYLTAIGRLDYTDEDGTHKHETFRNVIYQCYGGGGNIPWSAYYNLSLPDDPSKFPLVLSLSECVAANSAAKFRVIYTAPNSAHYRLKFSLKDSAGNVQTRDAAVDILVPRPVGRGDRASGKFIENPDVKGCT